jgi:hypothetical protein
LWITIGRRWVRMIVQERFGRENDVTGPLVRVLGVGVLEIVMGWLRLLLRICGWRALMVQCYRILARYSLTFWFSRLRRWGCPLLIDMSQHQVYTGHTYQHPLDLLPIQPLRSSTGLYQTVR